MLDLGDEEWGSPGLIVVAMGETGDRIADRLAGVVAPGHCIWDSTPAAALGSVVATADMVFILSGLEHDLVVGRVLRLAEMTRRSGVPTFLLVTGATVGSGADVAILEHHVNTLLVVTPACLVQEDGSVPDLPVRLVEEYLVRLAADTIITLIAQRSFICVDMADVTAIACAGTGSASLGIGIDGGEDGARDAASKALASLKAQGADPGAGAVLAVVAGSSNLRIEDFDAAARVLHEAVHEDADTVVGGRIEDDLGRNFRVMVVVKRQWSPMQH